MNELIAAISSDVNGSSLSPEARQKSGFVLLDDQRKRVRANKRLEAIISSWPIGVGIMLALISPALSDLLVTVKPYGMWLVYPFVELVKRPELHLGAQFSQMAPQIMLFLQFPLEGLIAKKLLKGRVTFSGVAGQVALYHFLGAVQLWLVCRALGDGLMH